MVCLIKPQFEAGREKVGKKGVVRDPAVHREVIEKSAGLCAAASGSSVLHLEFSPIKGPEGNIEYLLWMQKRPEETECSQMRSVEQVVAEAHGALDKPSEKIWSRKPAGIEQWINFILLPISDKDPEHTTTDLIRNYLEEKGKDMLCAGRRQEPSCGVRRRRAVCARRNIPMHRGSRQMWSACLCWAETVRCCRRPGTWWIRGCLCLASTWGRWDIWQRSSSRISVFALDRLISGDFTIEERMMIRGAAWHHSKKLMEDLALNDIVIGEAGRLRGRF